MNGTITDTDRSITAEAAEGGESEPPERAAGALPIRVELAIEADGLRPEIPAWLEDSARRAAGCLGVGGVLRATLVSDARMAEAHQRHCGVAGTTDVITFSYSTEPPRGVLDADLLVCADEARRQAAARGIPMEHELLLYIVHGMLHCLGLDDHTDADALEMHRREDGVFRALGLPPAYSAPERGPADQYPVT
jgi:probable rRNA maturation factor